MLKLDIGFFSTSLAIFMNNQDPQAPRKTKKNGVKNLKRAYPYSQLHLILNPLLRGLGRDLPVSRPFNFCKREKNGGTPHYFQYCFFRLVTLE